MAKYYVTVTNEDGTTIVRYVSEVNPSEYKQKWKLIRLVLQDAYIQASLAHKPKRNYE